MLLGDLGNLQQADIALVVDNGTTLDVSLGLVGKLHNVLGLGLHHVLQDAQVHDGTQVIHVGEEDDLNATLQELVENARVVQGLKDVAVARGVPLRDGRVEVLGDGEERVLVDSGVSGLVEGENVDVVALVLLDDGGGVVVGVERVHEDKRDVDVVGAVEVLNLTDGEIQKGHAVTNLDDRLGANAAHGGTKTTIELEDGKLVEEVDRLRVGEVIVVDNLALCGRLDAVPVTARSLVQRSSAAVAASGSGSCLHGVAPSLVVKIAAEEGKEVVHFGFEELHEELGNSYFMDFWLVLAYLLLLGVLHGFGKVGQRVTHLSGGDIGRGVLESLVIAC